MCLTSLSLLSIAFHRLRGMKHQQHIPVPHVPTWEASLLPSGDCKTWQLYCLTFTSASNYIHVSGRNKTSTGRIVLMVIKIKSILADKNHSLVTAGLSVSIRPGFQLDHVRGISTEADTEQEPICIREEPCFHSSITSTAWKELKTEVYLVT